MSYPRKIKGFRDIDANMNQLRWKIINSAAKVYKKYGFEHHDTPVLEYSENLGKYLPDSNELAEGVYSFKNPELEPKFDNKGVEIRDEKNSVVMENHYLTMRYDLTAPLARLYAESIWDLHKHKQVQEGKTPLLRRYQYGQVFRFEAKLDPGRFREFWQLDFDTVGTDDVTTDAEACMILSDALEEIGLKRENYLVKVNNRKIIKGMLINLEITEDADEQNIMRIIDKADKIGMQGIAQELGQGRTDEKSKAKIDGLSIDNKIVEQIMGFLADFSEADTRANILKKLGAKNIDNETYTEGVTELTKIDEILSALNFDEKRVIFDPTMIRGMGYYTGPIFEVEYVGTYTDSKGRKRKVGSICGGGRYDGLVEKSLGMKVPAVGASIGVDRLAEILTLTKQTPELAQGPVIIVAFDNNLMTEYQKIAFALRAKNIEVEVYYGSRKNLKKQLSYADKKNCPIAILIGENEFNNGVATVRNLKLGKELASQISDKKEWRERVQTEIKRENLTEEILKML